MRGTAPAVCNRVVHLGVGRRRLKEIIGPDVAHYVGAVRPLPYGELPPNTVNGVLVHDLSHNSLEEDRNGLTYGVDRVGYCGMS